ncbi:hypothetical protein LLE49_27315 [Alicyclobacillus tolerans]|uniref:recombination directionality factor n=1 Tax=Alicyclobacillus tolerans TaxID=90970 RepID=UPI001F2C1214|nr:hypothetical protein [Alicyclobacillus tolerans]MCF8568432.1 hypothetical protein [Alicyclobacillus tolerans]
MPIKGRSDVVRIPRIGKIHLGVKQKSERSGNEYPTAVDHFVVKVDESTNQKAVEAFHSVYGDQPREITVAFPSNNPEQFFPQFLSSYRRVGERYELYCKGDGEIANRVDGQGGRVQISCLYRDCPVFQEGKCKELGQLQFFLPDVSGIGVWQIDSSSWHTTVNLNGSIQMVMALTGGRIAMVPLKLRVVPKVVNPDGRPKTVYVLTLGIDDMKLTDFLTRTPLLTAGVPSVEPIPEDELPEDLYLDTQLVEDKPSTPESFEQQDESDADIAAVSEVKFKPYRDTEAAMVRLASLNGELLELLTAEPGVIRKLKALREGTAIRFQATPSQRWLDRLELVDFKVVS